MTKVLIPKWVAKHLEREKELQEQDSDDVVNNCQVLAKVRYGRKEVMWANRNPDKIWFAWRDGYEVGERKHD